VAANVLYVVAGCVLGGAVFLGSSSVSEALFNAIRAAVPSGQKSSAEDGFKVAKRDLSKARRKWIKKAGLALILAVVLDVACRLISVSFPLVAPARIQSVGIQNGATQTPSPHHRTH
jgi:hypothetical protein